eukprot:14341798-Alexandrium_andersonii.AAC.1
MVVAKTKGCAAPRGESPGLGLIKVIYATKQSYILQYSSATQKWPLVVACTWPNHQEVAQKLFAFALEINVDKAGVVAKRDSYKGKVLKKPATKKPACNSSSSGASGSRDINEQALVELAGAVQASEGGPE